MCAQNVSPNIPASFSSLEGFQQHSIDSTNGLLWLKAVYESRREPAGNGLERGAALAGLVVLKRNEALLKVRACLLRLRVQLPGLMIDPGREQIQALCALMDDTIDLTLDVWEPERTAFMAQLLPLQALLRRLAEED